MTSGPVSATAPPGFAVRGHCPAIDNFHLLYRVDWHAHRLSDFHLPAFSGDEMIHQWRNVLGTLPQWRDHDGENIQPKPEIFPKLPLVNHLFKVAVCGADNAHIHRKGLGAATRSISLCCSTRSSSPVPHGAVHRSHPEDRPAVGPFKTSPFPRDCAGKKLPSHGRTVRCRASSPATRRS